MLSVCFLSLFFSLTLSAVRSSLFLISHLVLEILLIYNPRHKSWNTGAIFPSPMLIWVFSHFSAPKYARLNIGEGEGHIWVRTKVWRVNVRNLEKIQDKWLLSQRFVTSIVGLLTIRAVLTDLLPWFGLYGKCFFYTTLCYQGVSELDMCVYYQLF